MRSTCRKALCGLAAVIVAIAGFSSAAKACPPSDWKKAVLPWLFSKPAIDQKEPSAVPLQPPVTRPTPAAHPLLEPRFLRSPNWLKGGDSRVLEGPYLA